MKRASTWTLASTMLQAAVLLLVLGCSSDSSKDQKGAKKGAPVVQIVLALKSPIVQSLHLTGSVEPYRIASLASPAEGPIIDLRVREGDPVKKGEVLLSIGRSKGVEALIASLQEELKKEEDDLRRTRQLVESEALPAEQLDAVRAEREKVRAELIKAQELAEDYLVTAPWGGVVSRLILREGEFAAPRQPVVEVYDPESLLVRVAVPEAYAVQVGPDTPVTLRLDAFPGKVFEARIARVYAYLDARLRTRTIEIDLLEPLNLLPGMFARVQIDLQRFDDSIVVPIEALLSAAGDKKKQVFIADGGKAKQRLVETGIEQDGRVQILSGIEANEFVIVAGNDKLKDGMVIRQAEKPDVSSERAAG